jgi:SAM-dependent methyltransferase
VFDRPSAAYRDDLAYIHDVGFGQFAKQAAIELLGHLRRTANRQGLVVDLGCGSGILSEAVSDAGFRVVGFDISCGMIDLARERVPQAEFHEASFLDVPLPSAIAVAAIGEVFNYCFDRHNTRQRLWRLFGRVFDALAAGGLFLFDVATPGRVPGGLQHGYTEGPGWACLYTAVEDARRKRLTRTITSFRQVGDLYRRDHEVHQLQLLDRAEVRARLRAVGFRVCTLAGYGDMQFPRGYVGFLARKP